MSDRVDDIDELGSDEDGYEDDDGWQHRRRRRLLAAVVAVVVLVGLGLGLGFGLTGGSKPAATPEGVPLQNVPDLASPDSTVGGTPVDGMTCRKTMDQTEAYHVHAHVAVFVNGQQLRIPAGAGIVPPRLASQVPGGTFVDNAPSSCLYWIHVHANDGIVHVEAPRKGNYTLGQFFDIWNQPLGPDQVGPAKGPVTAFVDGQRWTGDPRSIPLADDSAIQLDVGTPVVAFQPIHFKVTGSCSSSCGPPPAAG